MGLYNQGGSLIGGSIDIATTEPTGRSNGSLWIDSGNNIIYVKISGTYTQVYPITSAGITDLAIVNADVKADAAIAYSKLNLATSILNADVNASAGIAISKLATLEAAEANSTPVSDNSENNTAFGNRQYAFFTLPTTEKWYIITGIEWKVGTVSAGNIMCGVDAPIDANPPVLAGSVLVAVGAEIAAGTTSTTQRNSRINSQPIRGGTLCGGWVTTSDNTCQLRQLDAQANTNIQKTIAYSANPPTQSSTAWSAAVNRFHIKVYYRGLATQ